MDPRKEAQLRIAKIDVAAKKYQGERDAILATPGRLQSGDGAGDLAEKKDMFRENFRFVREDTETVLQRRIASARKGVEEARTEYQQGSWGKRFSSLFTLGGFVKPSINDAIAETIRQQDEALRGLITLQEKLHGIGDRADVAAVDQLKAVRRSLGLPELPIDLQASYDALEEDSKRGIRGRDRSLEVDWNAINAQLAATDNFLGWVESGISAVDTGMSIATGFVPGGAEVYALTHSMTDIATGIKSPKEALMEVGFTVLTAHVGGKVMQGKMGKALTEKIAAWAEKNAVAFVKNPKLAARLAGAVAGAGSGGAGGAVIGGGSAAAQETWNVATGKKSTGEGLRDVAKATVTSAAMGAGMGAAGGVTGLNQKIHEQFKDEKAYQGINKWLYAQGVETPLAAKQSPSPEEVRHLKDFLKSNPVDDASRLLIAEKLLGSPLNERQQKALLEAHGKPGGIDEGDVGKNTVKGLALMRDGVFTREQAQMLMDAGLAGLPSPESSTRVQNAMHVLHERSAQSRLYTMAEVQAARSEQTIENNWAVMKRFGKFKWSYTIDGKTVSLHGFDRFDRMYTPEEEHLLVNALLMQVKGAERFGLDSSMVRNSLVPGTPGSGWLMEAMSPEIDMHSMHAVAERLRKSGLNEKQVCTELAGQILHESFHDPDSRISGTNLYGKRSAYGEITSVTGQTAYYILERFDVRHSAYNPRDCVAGREGMQKSAKDVKRDYDRATAIAGELIWTRLLKAFPMYAENLGDLDPLSAAQALRNRIPPEREDAVVAVLKNAIADSTDPEKISAAARDIQEGRVQKPRLPNSPPPPPKKAG